MRISLVFSTLLAAIALVFAFQNNNSVTLQLLDKTVEGSVALLIIASVLIGFIIGMIMFLPGNIVTNWKINALIKENETLKKKFDDEVIQYEAPGLGVEGERHVDL